MKNARRYCGGKYESGLDVKEIAKRLRAEYAAAMKAGELPKMKLSVTIDRYSGGKSLDVKIKSVEGMQVLNLEYYAYIAEHGDRSRPCSEWASPEFRVVLDKMSAMQDAYNFDDSDSMTDYFHVAFYGHVTVDSQYTEELRKAAGINLR